MKKVLGIIALASALMLTACANQPSNPTVTDPPVDEETQLMQPGSLVPLSPATSEFAQTVCPPMDALHLSQVDAEEFPGVFICGTDIETGTEFVKEITVGAGDLLEVYATPNAPVNPAVACVAMLADPRIIWITDKVGDHIAVYAPVDECGFPQSEVDAVWERVVTEDVVPSV